MRKEANKYLFVNLFLTAAWLVQSCDFFEYHPYETNVSSEYRDLNDKAIKTIGMSAAGKDTITIIAMGDTQRFYDEVEDFVKSANNVPADFVILNGDITDFGLKDEYEWVHEMMRKLNKPYVAVIGNHDLSGNGDDIYKAMYGTLDQSFQVGRTKFILLNTNSREYRFSGRVPDIAWLRSELNGDNFDQAVVVSHIPPYDGDFDPELEEAYATTLAQSGKVKLSLHGHQHRFDHRMPYNDNIQYLVSTSMNERMYLVLKVHKDGFTFKKVDY
jgi:3',5'-cyclic-AMP phosphodiesterase